MIITCTLCGLRIRWTTGIAGWKHEEDVNGDGKENHLIDLTHLPIPNFIKRFL